MPTTNLPVITIDGASGVGKGTVARQLAQHLGFHYLDSGALYRIVGWAAIQRQIVPEDHASLKHMIDNLEFETQVTEPGQPAIIICNGRDITDAIRRMECGEMASKLSAIQLVRDALLDHQHQKRELPGLVTDGRDMGTVVFPDATLKLFFTADAQERAKRRCDQLKGKGIDVSLPEILAQITARDERDSTRASSPLKPAEDAVILDTTHLAVDAVFDRCVQEWVTKN